MDPNRSTFDSVVRRVAEKERLKVNSFRSLARSVLSKENRIWRQEQIKEKNNTVRYLYVRFYQSCFNLFQF